jgi:hypothetical protein
MKRERRCRTIVAWLLLLLMVQTIGCSSFVPLAENPPPRSDAAIDSRVRVLARDQSQYVFPANQCTIRYAADSTVAVVRGWGDKYTSFGLVDQGFFELKGFQIKDVEIEKVRTSSVVLLAGAVVGLSVLTILGVKVVTGDGSSGRGRTDGPAEGN